MPFAPQAAGFRAGDENLPDGLFDFAAELARLAPWRLQTAQFEFFAALFFLLSMAGPMKIRNSLKSAKLREKGCFIVRRRGRVYVINKKNPRFKARQG